MAKGNGSDYENMEEEVSAPITEEYCDTSEQFNEPEAEPEGDDNYEEYAGDEGEDDEYRPLAKRGRPSESLSPRSAAGGAPTQRFRGRGGFSKNNANAASRFRGTGNWDQEWNPAAANESQRNIPSLMDVQVPNLLAPAEAEGNDQTGVQASAISNNGYTSYQRPAGEVVTNASQGYSMDATSNGVAPGTETNESSEKADDEGELWVETKTAEGKSYYYHAKTRNTTWTKPEGDNIKIISQEQVEAMAANAAMNNQQGIVEHANDENQEPNVNMNGPVGTMGMPPHMMGAGNPMAPPNTMQPPPGMMQPPFGAPPFGGPPPFGMPPPGFPPTGFPGGFQPPPWGFPQPMQSPMMPPNMMPPQHPMMPGFPPGMGLPMPGMDPFESKILAEVDPEIIARASEWSEHRAPDGRSYFYNAKMGESVWERPQPMKDLDAAKFAASQKLAAAAVEKPPPSDSLPITNSTSVSNAIKSGNKKGNDGEGSLEEKRGDEVSSDEDKKNERVGKEDNAKELTTDDAGKRKKDESDKPVQKVQDKSKPVSSTPVPGTPWCVVWTGDGRVFFYNPSARCSVWDRPDELKGRADVAKMVMTPPAVVQALKKDNQSNANENANKKSKPDQSNREPQQASANLASISGTSDKHQINVGKEAAMEAEVRAARERAVVPLETRVNSFREMLQEKEVSAFSTWEKELHKIVFDPRYLLLTSKERKQVFEKYVKERAEEERQEKRNRMRQRKDDYRKLMEDANLHGKSSFSDFASKYAKDERFKNIEKVRERESLFNEFILDVRKREKEEKNHKREQARKEFMELLREHSEIDRHSRWSDVKKKLDSDSRYKAVDSSSLREDYFHDYVRILKDEKRRKEKERKKEKVVEEEAESDPELTNASDAEKDKEAEKAARVEASLREREKEVQRTLAVHLRDRDNEREQHKHDEAVHHFNALLADLVRNSELSWREAKRQLRKDHRWDSVDLLDREEKEKLFNEHIEQLNKKKREKFRELLDETSEITVNSSWKDIRRLIKEDPRYTKFSSSERKCEKEFKEYIKDKLVAIKTDFRELLQETKLITHKSYSMVKENENYLKDIEDILKNDKRYLMLDHIPDERRELVMEYLDDLEKRGPPPPPTASEPSRRIVK